MLKSKFNLSSHHFLYTSIPLMSNYKLLWSKILICKRMLKLKDLNGLTFLLVKYMHIGHYMIDEKSGQRLPLNLGVLGILVI